MRFAFLFLFLLGLSACQKVERAPKPKNLIPADQMVEILVDLAKIDAARSVNRNQFEERGGDQMKELLFEKYGIDSTRFVQSSYYYSENFRINDTIYSRVKRRLQQESDSLYKLKAAAEKEEPENVPSR